MKPKVLVVDDNDLVRRAIARSFHRAGWACAEAGDLAGARAAARADLAVIELIVGTASGLDLVADLAARMPVVVMTSLTSLEIAARAARLGAVTVVQKPTRAAGILAALERARTASTRIDLAAIATDGTRDRADLDYIRRVLDLHQWHVTRAAKYLRISRSTLYRIMDRMK